MYKVMVVDDEPWGRKSVSKLISELALDVEVIAEARHGKEALELIAISKPQIVVTDMNMPVMNGQQLLEMLYKEYSEIKVIVISGHSQFEYLKAAVTYQACEYVLKPVSPGDLKTAMLKAMEACRNHLSLQQQKRSADEMRKLRTESFLQHVTGRRIANSSDILLQSAELGILPPKGCYRLAVCRLRRFQDISRQKYHGNADLFMYSIENIMYEVLQEERPLSFKSDDKTRLCLLFPESAYTPKRIVQLLAAFHEAVSRMLHTAVVAGISSLCDRLDRLPEAFDEANELLRRNPLQETGFAVCSPDGAGDGNSASGILTAFEAKMLQQAMAARDAANVRRLLQDFRRKLEASMEFSIGSGQRELRRLAELADGELKGLLLTDPALFEARATVHVLSLPEAVFFVDRLEERVADFITNRGLPESVHSIRAVTEYLDAHYFEDVSLIDVATRYHMDPSYLSRQFKTVTGENFIEYITRKRMEKSCELLRSSDRKINDISELVGYENQRYFSQVFKKFTGLTPSEYRESEPPAGTSIDTKY